jgi:DNA processing protein
MLQYKIALTMIPGIGDISGKKLVAYCGGVEEVFKKSRKDLISIKELGTSIVNKLIEGRDHAIKKALQEIRFIEKHSITAIFFLDKEYPYRLANCVDSPMVIYYRGNANLSPPRILGVVGTRSATDYGKEICSGIIKNLADTGVLILSGLAYGIDSCAHKTALTTGLPTVAVLGHGLDQIYPAANKGLADKMLQNGGLLSEFPSNTKPDRENFPMRNRVIAGLCDALLVVEAANTGGALITADIANSYDRDVFAVPGRVGDMYSGGCNRFIKTNRAALVETADDIKYLMGWETKKTGRGGHQQKLFVELTPEEQKLADIIKDKDDAGIDLLVAESEMSNSKIAAILLNLEFKGVIKCLPGKRYQLL